MIRILIIGLFLIGCGSEEETKETKETPADVAKEPVEEVKETPKEFVKDQLSEGGAESGGDPWYISEEKSEAPIECDEGYKDISKFTYEEREPVLLEMLKTHPEHLFPIWIHDIWRHDEPLNRWASPGYHENSGYPDLWKEKEAHTVCMEIKQ